MREYEVIEVGLRKVLVLGFKGFIRSYIGLVEENLYLDILKIEIFKNF